MPTAWRQSYKSLFSTDSDWMVVCMLILFIVGGGGSILIMYACIFAYKFDNRNFKVD